MTQYTSERLHIATYSNGPQGRGISKIDNYYFASTSNDIDDIPSTSDSRWKDSIDGLALQFNETYKYLWNFERITYTDKTTSDTNRTMLAVYSKDGKGIVGIYEYYKCTTSSTPPSALPTISNKNDWIQEGEKDGEGNTVSLPIPTAEAPYLWNYEIIDYTEGEDVTSGPVCIGTFGTPGDSLQVQYQYAETISDLTDDWSDTEPTRPTTDGKWLLWMRQKMSNVSNWSTPIQISALNGEPGADGSDIDYIYRRSESAITEWENEGPNNGSWSHTTQQDLDNGWTHSPQGIDPTNKYEYMTFATKPAGTGTNFCDFSNQPVLWSKWGDKGQDGAGIEYKYCRALSKPEVYPGENITWTDDPQGVDGTNRYEYVCQLKTTYNTTTEEWDPEETSTNISLWNEYKEDGKYIYAIVEPSEIKKGATTSINVSLYQRIGDGEPEPYTGTAYLYYTIDSGSESNGTQFTDGTLKVELSATDKIQFTVYNGNGTGKRVIDKETILALADGETAYYLYHNKTANGTAPEAPVNNYIYSGATNENTSVWYDTQKEYSMYQTYKVCAPSQYSATAWGPVRRISGELTTYEDLWNALENESSGGEGNGIYSFTDNNGENRIGINADLIKVGAIRGKQLLNGEEVTNFFLTSNGQGETAEDFFGTGEDLENVAFKAGSDFAVTVDGTVFAKAGKIGNTTIGDIASKNDISNILVGGENVLPGTGTGEGWASGSHVGYGEFKFSSTEGKAEGLYYLDKTFDLEENTDYILSFKARGDGETPSGGVEFYLFFDNTVDTSHVAAQKSFCSPGSLTSEYQSFEYTFKTGTDVSKCKFRFDCDSYKDDKNQFKASVWYAKDIKLEKGTEPTLWSEAPADTEQKIKKITSPLLEGKLDSSRETEGKFMYSWTDDGIQMWDGQKDNAHRVFAVVKEESGAGEEYKLKMRGEVVAERGSVGAWTIGSSSIFAGTNTLEPGDIIGADGSQLTQEELDELGSVGMYCGNKWVGKSLLNGQSSPVRFYAGLKKNNNDDGTVTVTANFLVLEDGSTYMTAAEIGNESIISNGTGSVSFQEFIDKHNELSKKTDEAFGRLLDWTGDLEINFNDFAGAEPDYSGE